uniref:BHLH domain-containing protein n=1 Tax=Kalanchoe fedtschenkoi TaxID=63787 RepID=A0A7N0TT12_KALFE
MDADLHQARQFNPVVVGGGGGGSGGLTRYRSAPSSYFSNFGMEYKDVSDFLRPPPPKPLSPQIDRIFAQLASEIPGDHTLEVEAAITTPVMKLEIEPELPPAAPVMMASYTPSAGLPPPHPLSRTSSGVNTSSHRGLKSSAAQPVRIPVVEKPSSGSNIARHNSLPAGLFSQIDVHNVAAAYFCTGSNQANSSSDLMSAYSGIGNDNIKPEEDDDYMLNGFWNDSPSTEKLLTGVKRERAEDEFLSGGALEDIKPFSKDSNIPAAGEMKKSGLLSHHLSLPKSSMEMLSAMEKFLDLQDSTTVPVGVRAKRGCATHPRSIAERVRRTKISERMRRLQELVPNMDKQTNTSDMLDMAVDYIKDLQQRVQILQACRERCTC